MKYREKIDSFLAWTLVIIMSLMVINVLWQVFSRFIGRSRKTRSMAKQS